MFSKDLFKTNLKRLRDEKHWSQAELSAHCGLSTKQISRLENGGSFPNDTTLDRLSEVFNVHISTFFLDPADSFASLEKESILDMAKRISSFYNSLTNEATRIVLDDMNGLYKEGKFDRFAFEKIFSPMNAPIVLYAMNNETDENLKVIIKSAIKEIVKDSILKSAD